MQSNRRPSAISSPRGSLLAGARRISISGNEARRVLASSDSGPPGKRRVIAHPDCRIHGSGKPSSVGLGEEIHSNRPLAIRRKAEAMIPCISVFRADPGKWHAPEERRSHLGRQASMVFLPHRISPKCKPTEPTRPMRAALSGKSAIRVRQISSAGGSSFWVEIFHRSRPAV